MRNTKHSHDSLLWMFVTPFQWTDLRMESRSINAVQQYAQSIPEGEWSGFRREIGVQPIRAVEVASHCGLVIS